MIRASFSVFGSIALAAGLAATAAGQEQSSQGRPGRDSKPAAAKSETKPAAAAPAGQAKTSQPAAAAVTQKSANPNPAAQRASQPSAAAPGQVRRRVAYRPVTRPHEIVEPIQTDPRSSDYYEPSHRTIVRRDYMPYDTGGPGWRNPGGVGRSNEFYGNEEFINAGRPRTAATFGGTNGVVSKDQQIQMAAIANQKNAVMNNHIDAYARPFGFYGFGYGGGYMYGAPY